MKKILIASIVPVLMETTFAAFADGRMPKAPKKVTYVAITNKAVAATGNTIVNFRVTYQ